MTQHFTQCPTVKNLKALGFARRADAKEVDGDARGGDEGAHAHLEGSLEARHEEEEHADEDEDRGGQ